MQSVLKLNHLTLIILKKATESNPVPSSLLYCNLQSPLCSWCFDVCVSWMLQIPNSSVSSQQPEMPQCWLQWGMLGVSSGNQQARSSLLRSELLGTYKRMAAAAPLVEGPDSRLGSPPWAVSPSTQRWSASLVGLTKQTKMFCAATPKDVKERIICPVFCLNQAFSFYLKVQKRTLKHWKRSRCTFDSGALTGVLCIAKTWSEHQRHKVRLPLNLLDPP